MCVRVGDAVVPEAVAHDLLDAGGQLWVVVQRGCELVLDDDVGEPVLGDAKRAGVADGQAFDRGQECLARVIGVGADGRSPLCSASAAGGCSAMNSRWSIA